MKRILIVIVAVFIAVSVLMIRGFAEEPFFIAQNNDIVAPKTGEMPYRSGGTLYMPYTLFRGGQLGIYYAYNSVENFITIYNVENSITFYLDKGNAVYNRDQLYDQFNQRAVKRGNIVFLPVSFVCEKMGMTFSVIDSDYGQILRLKSRTNVLSDSNFLMAATEMLAEFHREYNSSETTGQTSPSRPVTTVPTTPTVTSATTEERPKPVYVTFDGSPGEHTEEILDALGRYDVGASFFLVGAEIENERDAVARMVGEGHFVGIGYFSSPEKFYESPESMLEELRLSNEALFKAVGQKTRVVRPPQSGKAELPEEFRDALAEAGYRLWDYDVDSGDSAENASSSRILARLRSSLDRRQTQAVLLFHDGAVTSGALGGVLNYLTNNGRIMKKISETELPVNFYNDIR